MEMLTAAKAAAFAVKNRESLGKIVLIALLVLLAPFLLIIMSMMGLLSAFSGEGVLQTAENMDVTGTAIYQSVKEVTDPFYEQVSEQLEEEKKEIEKAHTYTEVTYDEEGNPSYEKKCSAIVYKQVNYTSAAYIVAYLSYAGGLDEKTGKIDKGMAEQFLEEICEVRSISSDDTHFIVKNEFASLDTIAETYFPDEKIRKNFIASYQAYSEYFAMDESGTIEGDGTSLPGDAVLLAVPLYLQYQDPWGSKAYGDGTIRKNGCCPTCLAMVFSYLCQKNIYPDDVAGWAGNKYYVNGAGTSWGIFTPASSHWGVTCTNIGKSEASMVKALRDGKLVVASMGPGTFTKGGHFIVLTGITESGKIRVNDPNDSTKKNHINTEFSASLIIRESKNMWTFE